MVKTRTVSQWLSEICDPNSIHYDADAAEIYYPNNPRLSGGFDNHQVRTPNEAVVLMSNPRLREHYGNDRIQAIQNRFHAKYRNQ